MRFFMFHLLLFLIGRLDNLDKGSVGNFLCLYVCLCMVFWYNVL